MRDDVLRIGVRYAGMAREVVRNVRNAGTAREVVRNVRNAGTGTFAKSIEHRNVRKAATFATFAKTAYMLAK